MASKENATFAKKNVVPNSIGFNNAESAFLFKAVKVKKIKKKKLKLTHPDSKTISNITDVLLEIDKKVLEKLS